MRVSYVAVLLLVAGLFVCLPTVVAQDAPCRTVLANATNDTGGPGDDLDAAIGSQGEQIGKQIGDRWFDAQIANTTTLDERAAFVAGVADHVRERVVTVENCLDNRGVTDGTTASTVDLSTEAVERIRGYSRTLHWWINETRAAAEQLPADLRRRYDVGQRSLSTIEERIVALRESLARITEKRSPVD